MRRLTSWILYWFEQRQLASEMLSAIRDKDRRRIESLIELGFDANRPLRGSTLLEHAVRWDDRKLITFLLERGVRIRRNPWLIYNAIENQNLQVVEAAIKQGADINRGPWHCLSPLELAVTNRDLVAIQFLIENGARETSLRFVRWHAVAPDVAKVLQGFGFYVDPVAFTKYDSK